MTAAILATPRVPRISRLPLVFLFLLCATRLAQAQTISFSGFVDDEGATAEGLFDFSFALKEENGAVVWSEEQPATIVTGGVFAVDLGVHEPLPLALPATAELVVTIDGDELPPVALARLARVARAHHAPLVGEADLADDLGGLASSAYVASGVLGRPGGPPVSFSQLTDVPSGLVDEDNGLVVEDTDDGLLLVQGELSLADVAGDRLAPGSLTGDAVQSDSLASAQVKDGTLTSTHVVDGSLTRAVLSSPLTRSSVSTEAVFRVTAAGCSAEQQGLLTTKEGCTTDACNLLPGGAVGQWNCARTSCVVVQEKCFNEFVGRLVR
jgi:hypothetical protein